jgi:glycosyltransferase involved in cell wall biosynthesis
VAWRTESGGIVQQKVLIFIVSYNAGTTIADVLSRIPMELSYAPNIGLDILIIDDSSSDNTITECRAFSQNNPEVPLTILVNPKNMGYGANQKLGYQYAIDRGYDVVCLLHGDGQYAPEELPKLMRPLLNGECEAVFGSRMLNSGAALKGGMPLYKYYGNKVLTWLENKIVGTNLSEYHSGYRLYSVQALKNLPFEFNSPGFDFDTDIIIQLYNAGYKIQELPIPTFYGDEICNVNGIPYAFNILSSCLKNRMQQLGLLYQPKFDLEARNDHYQPKFDFLSSHSLGFDAVKAGERLLVLGCGSATLVAPFATKGCHLTVLDQYVSPELEAMCDFSVEVNLNEFAFQDLPEDHPFDTVLALDIIEHLISPESFLESLRQAACLRGSRIILSTPNITFLPLRFMVLFGFFNYGKRGILDRTHMRLYTIGSLHRMLQQAGFEVISLRGVPAPFPLAFGRTSWIGKILLEINRMLVLIWPGAFSYQIYCEAKPSPTLDDLLAATLEYSAQTVPSNETVRC